MLYSHGRELSLGKGSCMLTEQEVLGYMTMMVGYLVVYAIIITVHKDSDQSELKNPVQPRHLAGGDLHSIGPCDRLASFTLAGTLLGMVWQMMRSGMIGITPWQSCLVLPHSTHAINRLLSAPGHSPARRCRSPRFHNPSRCCPPVP